MKLRSRKHQTSSGFSLVEMMVTIAVVGVIAGIAVSGYGNINRQSKDRIAGNTVETLNQAVRKFSHANWDLRYAAVANSAADEMRVLRSLQWREPDGAANEKELLFAGPYMRNDWNPTTSSDVKDWRIQWTGSTWKLLEPDESGAGLKVDFDAADLGKPYQFPPGFKPVGAK